MTLKARKDFMVLKQRDFCISQFHLRHLNVLDFMDTFLHCLSKLHSEIGGIDVNQRFWVIESNFC